ncbi:MAG: CPBP family intramembrane metalloprotease [Anaerolineales bacterium]|nr:CPBP family intramembrane metalloprotease [Anaerolineales bacterium]
MTAIKKYPVLTYFALAFMISWGCILIVTGLDGFMGTREISEAQLPFVYLAVLAGPSIAGILLTGLVDGKTGFREMGVRLFKGRVAVRWYAVALLIAPLLMTAILCLLSLASPVFLPAIVTADDKPGLLLTGTVMGLAVAFFEELGWTGFAIPRLRQRYGIMTTGLITGILWGLWHLPLFLGSIRSAGTFLPGLYLSVMLFSFLPAYRVLMVWVYDQTGSLSLTMLMHAPLTASQLILNPPAISGTSLVIYNLLFTAALWIIVAIVAVLNKRQRSQLLLQRPMI